MASSKPVKEGMGNLLSDIPQMDTGEVFQTLWQHGDVRMERILSHGGCSAPDSWYDQDEHEWVLEVISKMIFFAPAAFSDLSNAHLLHVNCAFRAPRALLVQKISIFEITSGSTGESNTAI